MFSKIISWSRRLCGLLLVLLFAAHCHVALAAPAKSTDVGAFDFNALCAIAEGVAAKDYVAPQPQPEALKALDYDQWRSVRFRPERALWRDEGLPFEVQFFHQGFNFDRGVAMNVIDNGKVVPFAFSSDMFEYPEDVEQPQLVTEGCNFAGFRIHYPLNSKNYKDELAVFLGASYFRALGKRTQYGLSARGIALDTALPSGEEFPWFREFWLEKPSAKEKSVTVYALLDSPSCAGAYRFVITPGDDTKMDVECRMFFRRPVAKIGMAPLTSMFFYGEAENGRTGDYRPEVHDSDGLLIETAGGEWLWRPIRNDRRLGISRISDAPDTPEESGAKVRGFGLVQRDRSFDHYQDLEAHYGERPSLWIEPGEGWGAGSVELVEIPSDSEFNDNVVAYWVPDEKSIANKPLAFSYTMKWGRHEGALHKLGRVVATRSAKGDRDGLLRFIVDFEGGGLDDIPADAGMTSIVEVEGAKLVQKHLQKIPETGGWRVSFQIEPEQRKGGFPVFPAGGSLIKMSAVLKKGENIPDPLTETWTSSVQREH